MARTPRPRWIGATLLLGSVAFVVSFTLLPFAALAGGVLPPPWCLRCGDAWLTDAVSNVVLFLPLGASLAACGMAPTRALGVACAGSLLIETLQWLGIPPMRSAATADVLTNSAGGWIGAALWHAWPALVRPSKRQAERWLASWVVLTAGVLIATGAAFARRGTIETPLRRSPYRYAPAFGWYLGHADSLRINRQTFSNAGEGPYVLEASAPTERLDLRVRLARREDATYPRAFVYLHPVGDSSAFAVLSQDDRDLRWWVRFRANDWGLRTPTLRLAHALPAPLDAPMLVEAQATAEGLTLRSRTPGGASGGATGSPPGDSAGPAGGAALTATLRPTVFMGWALLQAIVPPNTNSGVIVSFLWLLTLAVPVGWFSAFARRPTMSAVGAVAVLAAAAAIGTRLISGAAPSALPVLFSLIMILAAWRAARSIARELPPDHAPPPLPTH